MVINYTSWLEKQLEGHTSDGNTEGAGAGCSKEVTSTVYILQMGIIYEIYFLQSYNLTATCINPQCVVWESAWYPDQHIEFL